MSPTCHWRGHHCRTYIGRRQSLRITSPFPLRQTQGAHLAKGDLASRLWVGGKRLSRPPHLMPWALVIVQLQWLRRLLAHCLSACRSRRFCLRAMMPLHPVFHQLPGELPPLGPLIHQPQHVHGLHPRSDGTQACPFPHHLPDHHLHNHVLRASPEMAQTEVNLSHHPLHGGHLRPESLHSALCHLRLPIGWMKNDLTGPQRLRLRNPSAMNHLLLRFRSSTGV